MYYVFLEYAHKLQSWKTMYIWHFSIIESCVFFKDSLFVEPGFWFIIQLHEIQLSIDKIDRSHIGSCNVLYRNMHLLKFCCTNVWNVFFVCFFLYLNFYILPKNFLHCCGLRLFMLEVEYLVISKFAKLICFKMVHVRKF